MAPEKSSSAKKEEPQKIKRSKSKNKSRDTDKNEDNAGKAKTEAQPDSPVVDGKSEEVKREKAEKKEKRREKKEKKSNAEGKKEQQNKKEEKDRKAKEDEKALKKFSKEHNKQGESSATRESNEAETAEPPRSEENTDPSKRERRKSEDSKLKGDAKGADLKEIKKKKQQKRITKDESNENAQRSSKRQRVDSTEASQTTSAAAVSNPNDSSTATTPPTKENKLKKRKSVSFEDGVKPAPENPGDDAARSEKATGNGTLQTQATADQPEELSPEERLALKRKKRAERPKKRKVPDSDTTPAGPGSTTKTTTADTKKDLPPMLKYLKTYHKSRENWKFQKVQESHILKHALDVERIPVAYNTSLRVYLLGLKSASAKERIATAASEFAKGDEEKVIESAEKGEGQWGSYQASVKNFKEVLHHIKDNPNAEVKWPISGEIDTETRKRLESRLRAGLVLDCVGTPKTEEPQKQTKTPEQPVAKKRKNRTAVVEDSSESESSSDDNDSDSDSDSDNADESRKASRSWPSSSSSSSSSDSDSDSDSDSSSDSDSD